MLFSNKDILALEFYTMHPTKYKDSYFFFPKQPKGNVLNMQEKKILKTKQNKT